MQIKLPGLVKRNTIVVIRFIKPLKNKEKAPKEKASIRGKIKDGQEKVASTVPKPTENAKTAPER